MISADEINALKEKGAVIITQATYKKSVKVVGFHPDKRYVYKDKVYDRAEWMLTYIHKQYYHLYNSKSF